MCCILNSSVIVILRYYAPTRIYRAWCRSELGWRHRPHLRIKSGSCAARKVLKAGCWHVTCLSAESLASNEWTDCVAWKAGWLCIGIVVSLSCGARPWFDSQMGSRRQTVVSQNIACGAARILLVLTLSTFIKTRTFGVKLEDLRACWSVTVWWKFGNTLFCYCSLHL